MTTNDPGFTDLAEAITNALAVQLTTDGIPLWPIRTGTEDKLAQVAHICLEQTGQHQNAIAIRTSDSQTWYLIPARLEGHLSNSEPSTFGRKAAYDSYQRFRHLNEQASALTNAAKSALSKEEQETITDMLFQAWYDNLEEDDQQHWDRWTSGGYATKDDWRSIGPVSKANS